MKYKVCFICLSNLYLAPFFSKYIANLNIPYDVIYWDRHNLQEASSAEKMHSFQYKLEEGANKVDKLIGYLKFRQFAKKVLIENEYAGVIALTTSAGLLLKDFLKEVYFQRYIIDIRDYTMEENFLFQYLERDMIRNSYATIISSRGYEEFLPSHQYILSHNDIDLDPNVISSFRKRKIKRKKINISFIGLIRFHEQNKRVIKKFANDERFSLNFIGMDANSLRPFCDSLNVKNVNLIDRFPPEKTLDYYTTTDVINNIYGNNSNLVRYALSNKLYYAALLGMPILVSTDTFMEKVACGYGIGYSVDLDSITLCDDIYNYYNSIDWGKFHLSCDKFLEKVKLDNEIFKQTIERFTLRISKKEGAPCNS